MIWILAALVIMSSLNWTNVDCKTGTKNKNIQPTDIKPTCYVFNRIVKVLRAYLLKLRRRSFKCPSSSGKEFIDVLKQIMQMFDEHKKHLKSSNRKSMSGQGYRVIHGSPARDGQFPFMAFCVFRNNKCGASIISTDYILTAAHCVDGTDPNMAYCRVGNERALDGTKVFMSEIITHPSFEESNHRNDLALLKTSQPITLIPGRVEKIYLNRMYIDQDEPVTVLGWGSKNLPKDMEEDFENNKLQFLKGQVVNLDHCNRMIVKLDPSLSVDSTNICVFSGRGGLCLGDSGSPIVHKGKLIGVISWLEPCARGYPDVGQIVSHYLPWITSHVNLPYLGPVSDFRASAEYPEY